VNRLTAAEARLIVAIIVAALFIAYLGIAGNANG
jgi:hypothetical protein